MKKSVRFLVSLLVPAFMVVAMSAIPAVAQEKAKPAKSEVARKVLLENDKVQVMEVTFKPGDVNSNVPRSARVVRALKGGTLMRTYADGKTEKVEWKTGEVRFNPAAAGASPQYTAKNIGKSELVLYVVALK